MAMSHVLSLSTLMSVGAAGPGQQWVDIRSNCKCVDIAGGEVKLAPCDVTHEETSQQWSIAGNQHALQSADESLCVTAPKSAVGPAIVQNCSDVTDVDSILRYSYHVFVNEAGNSYVAYGDNENETLVMRLSSWPGPDGENPDWPPIDAPAFMILQPSALDQWCASASALV